MLKVSFGSNPPKEGYVMPEMTELRNGFWQQQGFIPNNIGAPLGLSLCFYGKMHKRRGYLRIPQDYFFLLLITLILLFIGSDVLVSLPLLIASTRGLHTFIPYEL